MAIKIATLQHRTVNTGGEQGVNNGIGTNVLIIFIELINAIAIAEAITTDRAVHGPRGHLHAVKGQRNGQTDEIHGIARIMPVAIAIGVVVFSAEPEEAGAHVFGELTGDGDTGAVSGTAAEDRVVGNETGQAEVLEAHTNLGVAHFEEQDALQGFGSDDVNLGTQTLGRGELVFTIVLGKAHITHFPRKFPQTLGLDISSLRTSRSAEHEAGSKKQSHDALHFYSFLLK